MMVELKPCPFCGSSSIVMRHYRNAGGIGSDGFCAHCDGCGAEGTVDLSEEEAAAFWNTRSLENELRRECDKARAEKAEARVERLESALQGKPITLNVKSCAACGGDHRLRFIPTTRFGEWESICPVNGLSIFAHFCSEGGEE